MLIQHPTELLNRKNNYKNKLEDAEVNVAGSRAELKN